MNWKSILERVRVPGPADERFWFTRYAKPLIFLVLILAIAGAYLATTIPISVFPTTDFPRVMIGVDNGVMPIDQMMVTITRPIEEAVNSVPGLQQVRSITSRGSAEIDLFFDWHVNMVTTLQLVDAAMSRIRGSLPSTVNIETHRLTFASFPIIGYSLTSDTVPQTQLWELATYDLKPRLNRLDGVATVLVQGGQEPEFHITPDPAKLLAANVTVTDILDAVRRTNLIDSPGLLQQNHQLYLGLVDGQVHEPRPTRQHRDQEHAGGDSGAHRRRGLGRARGEAGLHRSSPPTASRRCCSASTASRTATRSRWPTKSTTRSRASGSRCRRASSIEPFYDQSEIVTESINSVRDAILIGLILASLIMVLFLRDWGTSLVAGLVIPVTVLVTFIVLKVLSQSFNLMTLGGLAAAVGLVIDDAIVVVENIALHRDAGQGRIEAIRSALEEITVPLIGSTITPIVVFLPLIAITGVTGVFFRALAITVSVSLFTSLALALTWTPTLSQYFIRRKQCRRGASARCEGLTRTEARCSTAEEAALTGRFRRSG